MGELSVFVCKRKMKTKIEEKENRNKFVSLCLQKEQKNVLFVCGIVKKKKKSQGKHEYLKKYFF